MGGGFRGTWATIGINTVTTQDHVKGAMIQHLKIARM